MTGFSALPTTDARIPVQWVGSSKVLGPKVLKMPILTIGMVGLQIIWSVEMSYASPYLLSLGMSKSLMSVVFLAGPLSGLIVQPLIGIFSDRSTSRFGRRRPYILSGALISFAAMYLLGFTRDLASVVTKRGSTMNNSLTIFLAVLSIYGIDFSINAVQAMDRALLVDILPVSEQERGNAWAGRMFGLGSVLGFFAGNIDLTSFLSFLGRTQLEILCVITSCILLVTHLVTLFNVKERVFTNGPDNNHTSPGLWHSIKSIWTNFFRLPGAIKRICYIQLFAWIGWFPVLFWTSLYVGDLHKRNSPVPQTDDDRAFLNSEATRLGSRALLCNALASLLASVVCPFFVTGASGSGNRRRQEDNRGKGVLQRHWERRPTCHLAILWTISHGAFAICMLSTFLIANVLAATIVMTLTGFSWAITQWAPFALIAEAIHAPPSDSSSHSFDVAEDIQLGDTSIRRTSNEQSLQNAEEAQGLLHQNSEVEDKSHNDPEDETVHIPRTNSHIEFPTNNDVGVAQREQTDVIPTDTNGTEEDNLYTDIEDHNDVAKDVGSIEDDAGIILGIHNIFIVIPQFIITGLSSIIFAVLDPKKSVLPSHAIPQPGSVPGITNDNSTASIRNNLLPRAEAETSGGDSVGVIFRIGGISATIACVLCWRLAKELKRIWR